MLISYYLIDSVGGGTSSETTEGRGQREARHWHWHCEKMFPCPWPESLTTKNEPKRLKIKWNNSILFIQNVSRWVRYVQAPTDTWKGSFPAHGRLHKPLFVVHCPSISTEQRDFTGVRRMKESIVNQERGNKMWKKLVPLPALYWTEVSTLLKWVSIKSILRVFFYVLTCVRLLPVGDFVPVPLKTSLSNQHQFFKKKII